MFYKEIKICDTLSTQIKQCKRIKSFKHVLREYVISYDIM
jgi:hypothetical protein